MCGLVGIAGKLEFKDEATMKRLLLLDYLRGPDSTGLAAIRSNGESKLCKVPSHPLDLFDMGKFKEALNGNSSIAFIGHNRAATRGAVNHFNAHPYQCGSITGAHNGTLETADHAMLEGMLGEKYATDSHALFAAIDKFGVEGVVPLLTKGATSSTGAWSLTWFDDSNGTLNFLRNAHRPMWYAYNEEFDRIFWASEWPMIEAAVKLSNIGYKFFSDPDKGYRFWTTDEDIWYSYDVNELKKGSKTRPKPKAKKVAGKEPKPVVTTVPGVTGNTYDPFNRGTTTGTPQHHSTTGTSHGKTTSRSADKPVECIHLQGDNDDPFAGIITKEKFAEMAKYGCSWCQTDVEWGEAGVTIFETTDTVLCPNCSSGDHGSPRIHVRNLDLLL